MLAGIRAILSAGWHAIWDPIPMVQREMRAVKALGGIVDDKQQEEIGRWTEAALAANAAGGGLTVEQFTKNWRSVQDILNPKGPTKIIWADTERSEMQKEFTGIIDGYYEHSDTGGGRTTVTLNVPTSKTLLAQLKKGFTETERVDLRFRDEDAEATAEAPKSERIPNTDSLPPVGWENVLKAAVALHRRVLVSPNADIHGSRENRDMRKALRTAGLWPADTESIPTPVDEDPGPEPMEYIITPPEAVTAGQARRRLFLHTLARMVMCPDAKRGSIGSGADLWREVLVAGDLDECESIGEALAQLDRIISDEAPTEEAGK